MSKNKLNKYNITDIESIEDSEVKDFTLDNLSANLILSLERTKIINELYENNHCLKEKSDKLITALDNEKNINNLQSEFVSLVSHEFKTPLSIIKASSDLLKMYVPHIEENDFFIKHLKKVDKAVIRMNTLIESTLNLSKLETGKLEFIASEFSLKSLLFETIDKFKDLNKDVDFQLNVNDELYYNGDKNLIEQVFINLVSNSLKYSSNSPKVILTALKKINSYIIEIEDNGIGIDQKDLERLFSKFFRAKNSVGIAGTGIGLYLVKKFIELHHGNIKVESKLDNGTKFIITLPIE